MLTRYCSLCRDTQRVSTQYLTEVDLTQAPASSHRGKSPEHSHSRTGPQSSRSWEGRAVYAHTFRGLEEADPGFNLGPVDTFLLRRALHHELKQLDGDDVMVVYGESEHLKMWLTAPPKENCLSQRRAKSPGKAVFFPDRQHFRD